MVKLNEYTDKTKGIIHLMVTNKCDRNCKYCCNKQYPLETIPFVTDDELSVAHTVCITGGEPFAYANPSQIAYELKTKFSNIKNVFVYTNALEFYEAIEVKQKSLDYIDGLSMSIKCQQDLSAFEMIKNRTDINNMSSNQLYIFESRWYPKDCANFKLIDRKWQKEFVAANDSVFRRAANVID